MQRGQLFRTPLTQRARLAYTREFLDLIYAADLEPHQIQARFWEYFLGVTSVKLTGKSKGQYGTIMRKTAEWPWRQVQETLRKAFEAMVGDKPKPDALPVAFVSRHLSLWTGPDGRQYLHYGQVLPASQDWRLYVVAALDETLSDLRGLAVEALGYCAQCGRYFLRLRGTRRVYCSSRCTWQAFTARRDARRRRPRHHAAGSRRP